MQVATATSDALGKYLDLASDQMKLTAQNEFVSLFEMGSDGKQFWLWEKHEQVFWWGDFSSAGNLDSAEIPVRPDMVMEILGVRPVDASLLREPTPTMRFPQRVLLFDGQGRVAVWARLSDYLRMKMPSGDPDQWPWVAGRYELSFPYSGTTISFELSDVSLSHNGFPNAATYRMPDPETLSQSGVRVNHIDAQNGR